MDEAEVIARLAMIKPEDAATLASGDWDLWLEATAQSIAAFKASMSKTSGRGRVQSAVHEACESRASYLQARAA